MLLCDVFSSDGRRCDLAKSQIMLCIVYVRVPGGFYVRCRLSYYRFSYKRDLYPSVPITSNSFLYIIGRECISMVRLAGFVENECEFLVK